MTMTKAVVLDRAVVDRGDSEMTCPTNSCPAVRKAASLALRCDDE